MLVIVVGMTVSGKPSWWPFGKGKGGPSTECNDHTDNDGDGYCDFLWKKARCDDGSTPGDSGCTAKDDNDETNCGDGVCEGPETSENCQEDCGPADSCSDTDGGFDVFEKGTVTGYKNGNAYSFTDSCEYSNTTVTMVNEWYCNGDQAQTNTVDCRDYNVTSCIDGACQ